MHKSMRLVIAISALFATAIASTTTKAQQGDPAAGRNILEVCTNSSDLWLRSRPDKTALEIRLMPKSSAVYYAGDSLPDKSWHYIEYDGRYGWSSSEYLCEDYTYKATYNPPKETKKICTNTKPLRLREVPSNPEEIESIPKGERVPILRSSVDGKWDLVEYNQKVGWSRTTYLCDPQPIL